MKRMSGVISKDLLMIKNLVTDLVGSEEYLSKSRHRPLPYIRYVFMNLCKKNTNASLSEIGQVCGNRDHATVQHGLLKYDRYKNDAFFHDYLKLFIQAQDKIDEIIKSNKIEASTLENAKKMTNHFDSVCDVISSQQQEIKTLRRTVRTLKTEYVFKKIASLEEEDFRDFLTRANAFFEMKRIKGKYSLNI